MNFNFTQYNPVTFKWENTIWKVLARTDSKFGIYGFIENKKTGEKWDWEDCVYGPVIHNKSERLPKYITNDVVPKIIRHCKK